MQRMAARRAENACQLWLRVATLAITCLSVGAASAAPKLTMSVSPVLVNGSANNGLTIQLEMQGLMPRAR